MDNKFNSFGDLGHFLLANQKTMTVGSISNSKTISKDKGDNAQLTRAKIRTITNELMSEIKTACSLPPWGLHNIFENGSLKITEFPNGNIQVTVPFTNASYKKSIAKKNAHYSFIPILMSRGWSVHGAQGDGSPVEYQVTTHRKVYGGTSNKKVTVFSSGGPTFRYFAGTGELDRIINNFNAKYAPLGIRVTLDYSEDDLGWIPGHYKLTL